MYGHRTGREHADALIADLPAMAVRAVQHVDAPALGQAWDLGQLVAQAGRDQQPTGGNSSIGEVDAKTIPHPRYGPGQSRLDAPAVPGQFRLAERVELGRRRAVPAQKVVHMTGRRVALITCIQNQHRAAKARQRHRTAEPRGSTTNDHHVIRLIHHYTLRGRLST